MTYKKKRDRTGSPVQFVLQGTTNSRRGELPAQPPLSALKGRRRGDCDRASTVKRILIPIVSFGWWDEEPGSQLIQ
eukprot:995977-Rhodomonas_salina.2